MTRRIMPQAAHRQLSVAHAPCQSAKARRTNCDSGIAVALAVRLPVATCTRKPPAAVDPLLAAAALPEPTGTDRAASSVEIMPARRRQANPDPLTLAPKLLVDGCQCQVRQCL